ncbi:MAG TPA: hypothetical protein VG102_01330, partial [Candidatus Paceibacterota bacterium]|nr:hypothetical protein [Candidatus Paceibacterota bacterium]
TDYGSATVYPDSTDYGSATVYPNDYGSATVYPDTTVYDSTSPEYSYDTYSTDEYTTEEYSTQCGCYQQQSSSQPFSFSAPQSYSAPFSPSFSPPPIFPSAPPIRNIPIAYQQQQQQQQQQQVIPQQPNVITNNTCTTYSCNTVTTFSNSGNTTTVIPIAQAPISYPVQYNIPLSCTISVSQNAIQSGQYAYLTWQSSGATSATLSNYGNVAPNGSLSVQPYGSTSYVLTIYGANGQTATCNTAVTMANNYPSVTLSQIPYTGFDFGTMGDAMYFAMLAAFALSAGYLLVYYRGGVGAFAGAMIPPFAKASQGEASRKVVARKTVTTVASVAKVEAKVAPVVEKKIEAPVESPVHVATLASLPAFASSRPTNDSMAIAHDGGVPHIVISRN